MTQNLVPATFLLLNILTVQQWESTYFVMSRLQNRKIHKIMHQDFENKITLIERSHMKLIDYKTEYISCLFQCIWLSNTAINFVPNFHL